jgi:peptidoglycan/xylan/chitin deacetylase (PgdA/CDA1 family)
MWLLEQANAALTRRVRFRTARAELARPIASFSFDDFPHSAWTVGGPILARYGAPATYYASGRFCGAHEDGLEYYRAEDLRAVAAAGHEIGCHSFSHRCAPAIGPRAFAEDLDRNHAFLTSVLGDYAPETFAYPEGEACPRTKALASRRFPVNRGVHAGVNGPLVDMGQLLAVPLESRNWTADMVERHVETARRTRGWIIFFSHDVSDAPSSYGATPAMLEHALATVRAAGIDMLTVRDAMRVVCGDTPAYQPSRAA